MHCLVSRDFHEWLNPIKKCPDLWTDTSFHCSSVIQPVYICSFMHSLGLLLLLGCLLPCGNQAWGRQLKGYIWALWTTPITANGNVTRKHGGPYLHTSIHLSSVRTPGSRSSEPGLPRPYTADCSHHCLQETSSVITVVSAFHTATPPGQSFAVMFLIFVLFLCSLALLRLRWTPPSLPHTDHLLPAGRSLSWAIAVTHQNQFSLFNSSIALSQRGMGQELFPHNL